LHLVRPIIPAVLAFLLALAARADDLAVRVIVLANAADPASGRLAGYYAEKRGVPATNIIALPLSAAETITWPEFITTLWQPLQDELVRRGWIDAMSTTLTDDSGRKKYAIFGHKLSYLVVCRGVPLRIAHDPALLGENEAGKLRVEFRTNEAAVDSELALIAQSGSKINGFVFNPLFGNQHPTGFELDQVVKVARLDGPSEAAARNLVDSALTGEQQGLLGRYYVDLNGPHPDGDRWLVATRARLDALGFDGDTDTGPGTFPADARFDAPVLYFGWYAHDLNGPMALPGFRFPPGAIALHIHSFSAETLRSATAGWCGPFVARGVAATVGNVYEPYLSFTHSPNRLLQALAEGKNLGDAAYFALPVLSWQAVLIGDPLYRPFAVDFDQQWARLDQLPPALAPYAVLRKARLLDGDKRSDEALQVLRSGFKRFPSLALGLALARKLDETGDAAGAVRALEFVALVPSFEGSNTVLARQTAAFLAAHGAPRKALAIYQTLLDASSVPADGLPAILSEACAVARQAGDLALSLEWERRSNTFQPAASAGSK
jgi:uncharacterized protein (TIGR03790 family)